MSANADFNIDPSVWGPHLWATIHTLALKADSDGEVGPYLEFINSLLFLLPCETCRLDFTKWYKDNGDPVASEAFEWSVKLHNYVNRKLGKPIVTEIQARQQWNSDLCSYSCLRVNTGKSNSNAIAIALVIVVAACLWLYLRRKRS